MKQKQSILLIDDSEEIHRLIEARLRPMEVDLQCITEGERSVELALRMQPDLILLDVQMPVMDGFEVCKRLRQSPSISQVPIIFLTGNDDPAAKQRAFDMGAVDYVTKPFEPRELRARVNSALQMRKLINLLEMQARTDSFTGLLNRQGTLEVLHTFAQNIGVVEGYCFGVLFIDLDGFKAVNDNFGHGVGDALLLHIAKALTRIIRGAARGENSRDVVGRIGGDEFIIVCESISTLDELIVIAERLRETLSQPVIVMGCDVTIGASVGVRYCDRHVGSPDQLLRDSDIAMYDAKTTGKGRVVVFNNEMQWRVERHNKLEKDLRQALIDQRLRQHFQPIVNAESGRVVGFEALARWEHPTFGQIEPSEFIDVAEETRLIHDLGRWSLHATCDQAMLWRQNHAGMESIYLSMNLTKRQLLASSLCDDVAEALARSGVKPGMLTLEINEASILYNEPVVVPILKKLRELGVRVAVDDFGKGLSSLTSLHRFPIDILKIDRGLIACLEYSRPVAAIVQAIITLADNLNMSIVAEGVQTHEQMVQLQAMDCGHVQGHYISKPLTPADAGKMIGRHVTHALSA